MSENRGISRRAFVRDVAVGTAGVALAASGAPFVSAAGKRLGEITLDGLMITYFGALTSGDGAATFELGRAYDTTFRLRSANAPDFQLDAKVPEAKGKFLSGETMAQAASTKVPGALVLSRAPKPGEVETFSSVAPQTSDRTVFVGLSRPRLEIVGRPDRPRFRFVPSDYNENGSSYLVATAESLRADARMGLEPATAGSWLAQYTADRAGLAEPRYLPGLAFGGAGFSTEVRAGRVSSGRITATTSSAIVASTFSSGELAGVFGVGNALEVEYWSVQEDGEGSVLWLDVAADAGRGLHELYWDSVFKTYFFVPGA